MELTVNNQPAYAYTVVKHLIVHVLQRYSFMAHRMITRSGFYKPATSHITDFQCWQLICQGMVAAEVTR